MTSWRIVFMGTPDFAVPALDALLGGPDSVVGIFTQPDKPIGRGLKRGHSPVKQAVANRGIPVFQPARMRDPGAVADLRALKPDLVVVAAYGQILSEAVLATPRFGCINVHASLLPRWRGAAPLHRALLAGDADSGITIMRMDAGLDTGPILAMHRLPLGADMTGGQLHDRLAGLGGELLLEALVALKSGTLHARPQPEEGVTYAKKLTRDDERIDWTRAAGQVQRQILALNPWPAAHTLLDGVPFKVFRCRVMQSQGSVVSAPGLLISLYADGLEVACGVGSVVITELQFAGKRRMGAAEWLRGHQPTLGVELGK